MSSLDDIVQVTISRDTVSVTKAGFGTFATLSEFDTSKTTIAFERHRFYASLTEMETDAWVAGDAEYKAAQKVFAQNPKLARIMIGRKASTDATWTAAVNAIQTVEKDWYSFMVIGYDETRAVFNADLITANTIDIVLNGITVPTVTYAVSHANTMGLIKTAVELAVTDSVVTLETTKDPDARTMLFKVDGKAANTLTITVLLGASQAVASINQSVTQVVFAGDIITGNSLVFTINGTAGTAIPFNATHSQTIDDCKTQIEADVTDAVVTIDQSDGTKRTLLIDLDDDCADVTVAITGGSTQTTGTVTTNITDIYTELAVWVATQKKIFFYSSSLDGIIGSGSADIASIIKATNNDRVVSCYHPESQGDADPEWFESAWPGLQLPKKPGSTNWAFQTPTVFTSYDLTETERSNVLAKFCNIFIPTSGVDVTREGQVSDGSYIDERRGLDQLQAWLQEDIFAELVRLEKVPYTDDGIGILVSVMNAVFERASTQKILVPSSTVITIPLASSATSSEKANRTAPNIPFTSLLQGAINTVPISGIVSV